MIDYREGSPEMQANSYYETAFRDWLLSYLRANEFILKDEAVYSGAEVVGCSPTTTARYLKKLTSGMGVLREQKDSTGAVVIVFRPANPRNRTAAPGAPGKRRPHSQGGNRPEGG
jgi:hypothetical protein